MNRFWILWILSLMAGTAVAKVEFKSIENKGDKIEIVMEDREAGDNVMVTSAKLINDGRDIFATMMMCGLSNGVGTYTLTFPMQDSFINPEIVMVINGEETLVDIASDTKDFIKGGSEEENMCRCACGCED